MFFSDPPFAARDAVGHRPSRVGVAGTLVLALSLGAGCTTGSDAQPGAVAHLAACVERAPDQPCEPLPGNDAAFWLAEQADQTDVYLDAAKTCLDALLDGAMVGRSGACTDVYEAYVVDARAGRRDLDGRLDAADAGRAFGLAYSAVVARRSRETAESMTGTDYNALPGAPAPDSTPTTPPADSSTPD